MTNQVKFLGVVYEVGDWITDGSAPKMPGVYNVSCRKHDQSGDYFAHWDGKAWSLARDAELVGYVPGFDWGAASRLGAGIENELSRNHWHANGSYRGLLQPFKG